MKYIYLAGKYSNKEIIGQLGTQLEKLLGENFSTIKWWNIEQTKATERSDYESELVGELEYDGVIKSDYIFIIVDDKDYPYRGSLCELGIALGKFNYNKTLIKKHVYVLTKPEFTNENCGVLCVPHVYLSTIKPIIKSDNLLDLTKGIYDIIISNN